VKKRVHRPAVAALAIAVASALPAAHAEQAVEKGERIEVTGSRIGAASDAESASPIAIIRAEDIRLDGYQSIELVLNNYTQFFGDQGNRISNGATGTATANLRALGAQRTLVLLNGRRLVNGDPWMLAPDLNQLPSQLIQRVEVLTGGASAVYGSDAIAGVVNFILNDRFEGVQGDASYAFYNHQQDNGFMQDLLRQRGIAIPGDKAMDGENGSVSLTLGSNFANDKGNATVSFRHFKSKALPQSDRDYSACPVVSFDGAAASCGGSSAGYPGQFVDIGFFADDPSIQPRPRRRWTIDQSTAAIRPFNPAADAYNYAPLNYYQRPQERYNFTAFANYEVSPAARVYGEFGYHDDRTIAQIAPSAIFFQPVQVRYDNPLLTDAWRSTLVFRNAQTGVIQSGPGTVANVEISRRNVEGGGREADIRHTSFREVIGAKGQVATHWDYDAYFQYSQVNFQQAYKRDWSISRIARSLDVVSHPATGAPVCLSALNGSDPTCVPFNLWVLNGVTNEARAYVEVPAFQRALTTQQIIGTTASANLGDYGLRIPNTKGAVEVVLGFERRTEKLDFEADQQFLDLAGQGAPIRDVFGAYTVKDLFGEVRVPLFDVLNLTGSYRRSAYNTGNTTDTFGVGFNAMPAKTLRLRGSYQRAVRAPDVNELFSPQFPDAYGLPGESDPCAGASPARSLSDCQRTGVRPSQYGNILDNLNEGFFPSTSGGNASLKPETASTYTFGVVFAPTRDLSMTLDYFDIRIKDTIGAIGGDIIFTQCLNTGDPFFCGLITRDSASGALWYGDANVFTINQNIGTTQVSGADIAINYRWRLKDGHAVSFDGLGTYLRQQTIEPYPGAPRGECAGFYYSFCTEVPLPKWRHRLRVTWQPPWGFDLAATWRYIHSTVGDPEYTAFFGVPPIVDKQPAMHYLDLAGSWQVTKRLTLRAGVNNVADRDPPLAISAGFRVNGNAFAQVYDVLGRHAFLSATARF